jgi:hypothetical protein
VSIIFHYEFINSHGNISKKGPYERQLNIITNTSKIDSLHDLVETELTKTDYIVNSDETVRAVLGTNRNNTGNAEVQILSGLYRTNTAINSITFFFDGSTVFNSGTSIALYGVK